MSDLKVIKKLFTNAKRKREREQSQTIPVKILKASTTRKFKKKRKNNFETRSRKNSFLSRMEYSSTKSNRSLRSMNIEPSQQTNTHREENSIIIEEDKELDETTRKSSDQVK